MDSQDSPLETSRLLRSVRVWDAPTRLFHWLVVLLMASLYVTWRVNWMGWHALLGEALLALLIFRVLWGFFGSDTARFARFAATPREALRYLSHFVRREPDRQVGHNPAGSWMVFFFLAVLFLQTLSGLYVNNDVADVGPFTEIVPASVANTITTMHTVLWDVLLAAMALHVLAIGAYAALKRQNLAAPMITGRKRLPLSIAPPHLAQPLLAALLLAVAGGLAAACSILL